MVNSFIYPSKKCIIKIITDDLQRREDHMNFYTVDYINDRLLILDQTKLPGQEVYIELKNKEDVWEAIYKLKVRGAPAIGVAAALGLFVSVRDTASDFENTFKQTKAYLASSRPTAVNLFWALERMDQRYEAVKALPLDKIKNALLDEALEIMAEDKAFCRGMGEQGLTLLKPGMGILTHCNAGALATAGIGTCLAPIYLGNERGYNFKVYADETRPLLQGARLTSWELSKSGIDVTLICDNMAASVMKQGRIDAVVAGCDRMAANGDGANKIGTLGVAILAKEYGIPFYMYVPSSTIDLDTPSGEQIVIEQRDPEEIYRMWYREPMAPEQINTYNPAFDVTDHKYITAIITEKAVVYPPYDVNLRKLFE